LKKIKVKKDALRQKRKSRIRGKISGTSAKPRLSVFRSLNHIYAQIIDDTEGKTLVSISSNEKEMKASLKNGTNIEAAKKIGTALAKKAINKNITIVSFDRNGYLYHGRVKALADSAREAGLTF